MTPIKSIRKYCMWACNNQAKEVLLCNDKNCSLWNYRLGKKDVNCKLSSLKSIRKRCLDCQSDSKVEVKNCSDKDCFLYPFRLGKNPNRKGIGGNKEIYLKLPKNIDSMHDL